MRADMAKVICEDGRSGGHNHKPGRKYPFSNEERTDLLPKHEGIRKPYGYNKKDFGEHLGPLYRYLESNVNRPWDKVYSEMCEYISKDSVTQKHILTHALDKVERAPIFFNGNKQPFVVKCWGGRGHIPLEAGYVEYYVDQHGILRKLKKKKIEKKVHPPQIVQIHGRTFKQIEFNEKMEWFEIFLEEFNPERRKIGEKFYLFYPYDHIQKSKNCDKNNLIRINGKHYYCKNKKQISSREITRLGLKNLETS